MSGRLGTWVRYGLPGVVLGMLLSWGAEFHGEPGEARAQNVPVRSGMRGYVGGTKGTASVAASGEAGGILALVTNTTSGASLQWLYLIDTTKRAFAIYRFDSNNPQGSVKLEASRQFQWDLDLDGYNNLGLEPADVKARVEALNRSQANP